MLHFAICDDSSYIRSRTKESILKYSFQKDIDIKVDEYETGEDLLYNISLGEKNYQLIIMDYEFEDKGKNGIEIIKKLRTKDKKTKVIFLSSYTQVVFESFEVETFRFLIKPLDEKKLFHALDDFVLLLNDKIIVFNVNNEKFLCKENDISYIEGYGKFSILHFSDDRKELICKNTLASVENMLNDDIFFRCQKSYIINMEKVESYNRTEITMCDGMKIKISRHKYKEFDKKFTEFVCKRQGI